MNKTKHSSVPFQVSVPLLVSSVPLLVSVTLLSTSAFLGCGQGGPGDDKAPDATVWFDAATDTDASKEADATADAQTSQDAEVTGVETIDATTLRHQEIPYVMGQTYIDLRAGDQYTLSHIPKSKSLPSQLLWDGSALVDGGSTLETLAPVKDLPLFFYSVSANQDTTEAIAEAVMGIGYLDVYVLEGGIESWRSHGFYEDINLSGVYDNHYDPIPTNHYIIDSMPEEDYITGHITGAVNVDTELFFFDGSLINGGQVLLDAIPCTAETIIFYCVNEGCSASEKAAEAAELLTCYDNTQILHYPGGMEDWEAFSHPVSCGTDPEGTCP